jgi:hypothetical protein
MALKYQNNLLGGVMLMLLSAHVGAAGLKVLNIHTEHFSLECIEVTPRDVTSVICTFVEQIQ